MECPHCGNQLTIEDEKCPFCNRVNEQAAQYTGTMKTYKNEWSKAKKKVDATTRYVKSFTVPLIVTIVLAVLNIIVLILRVNVDDVENAVISGRINSNYDEYCEQLIDYLEQEDYYSFDSFYYHKDLYFSDIMREFDLLSSLTGQYGRIFRYSRYLAKQEVTESSIESEQLIETVGSSVKFFYDIVYSDTYKYSREKMPAEYRKYVDRMVELTEQLLSHSLNVPKEDIDNIRKLNQTQIAVMIGRSLGIDGY